jgi:hypothetical protein
MLPKVGCHEPHRPPRPAFVMASGFDSTRTSKNEFRRVNNFRGFTYGNGAHKITPALPERGRVST